MPPATGFQYTPPSYLLRASDTTNRPWSKSQEVETTHGGDGGDYDVNDYELPQEHRPQTRRESHLDAHFQQRVRSKQSRYRDILNGDADLEPERSNSNGNGNGNDPGAAKDGDDENEEDSVLLTAANADSYADVHSARMHAQSSKSNELARKNRKERITGVSGPPAPRTSASSAETARSLRAQRLRSSLLKQTPDEFDVQTKLEMRRLAHKEEEAAARRSGREIIVRTNNNDSNSNSNSNNNSNNNSNSNNGALERYPSLNSNSSKAQERKLLEEERRALQAEREALAIAKEEAAIALMRAAELNEERIRQRELDARLEAARRDQERLVRRRERDHKNKNNRSKKEPSFYSAGQKNKGRKIKTRNFVSCNNSTNTDGDTFMTEFDAENDFAFLNDLTGMVRDTGLLRTCGACFGDTEDVVETETENETDPKNTVHFTGAPSNVSSVFVPDLIPCSDNSASDGEDDHTQGSIRRSRVYAKYRE